MLSLQITNIKAFMSKLLLKDIFDHFLISETVISTFNTFQINGQINRNYYSSEELDAMEHASYSSWSQLRPFCFGLIKGSKTPSYLKIIFFLSPEETDNFLVSNQLPYSPEDINGLFLNVKYADGTLTCVTGTSVRAFTLDKSLEHGFDRYVQEFFGKNQIEYELL